MKLQYKLPMRVILPASVTVDMGTLKLCLGNPSPQLLHYWRAARNFPQSFRDGKSKAFLSMTGAVEKWLIEQGCEVVRR